VLGHYVNKRIVLGRYINSMMQQKTTAKKAEQQALQTRIDDFRAKLDETNKKLAEVAKAAKEAKEKKK
jgi:hypothetical protein